MDDSSSTDSSRTKKLPITRDVLENILPLGNSFASSSRNSEMPNHNFKNNFTYAIYERTMPASNSLAFNDCLPSTSGIHKESCKQAKKKTKQKVKQENWNSETNFRDESNIEDRQNATELNGNEQEEQEVFIPSRQIENSERESDLNIFNNIYYFGYAFYAFVKSFMEEFVSVIKQL
ncbi:uncharacterized protein LOC111639456 [Centruroides sculpturatus]|uniref:uncharacterized protein LOC111639456 n=1 Tax=Centruroides sculpturatus TaxID=218467 RepID=UPI000C6CF1AB|nr:uncharacterized protein LOC111639456 [Centruroides sculpturatus]XP_023241116.1 uncharacterized protein LOC111639456 [Centruroides sculpturatus]XP_023241117.1 uncharacterized protein LOC111639456 [Centruroides sculpturatus]